MRLDKQKLRPSKSLSNKPPMCFVSSSNHVSQHDPAPSFSHITPTSHAPPVSNITPTGQTPSVHHKQSYCTSTINRSASGVRTSSYCPACNVRSDPLTCPIITGCMNIIDICKGHSSLGLTIVGGCNTLLVRNRVFFGWF